MLFSSIPFLFYFLPCVLLLYAILPGKIKNVVLLLFSLVFYGWGEPKYVFLMMFSIAAGYICGLLIEKFRGTGKSKAVLIISLVINLGFLGYFKYMDFFISSFSAATGISVELLRIALPIGISFYTFQILSYIIDTYRGDVKAQRNILDLACYVTMFPQLIAGPIVRYSDIMEQLENRQHTFDKIGEGTRRFILGLAKKILIANTLGALCEAFKASSDQSVLFFWLYAAAFSLHIYFDFSGYSDMAIGLGKIFAFDFLENFNYPFISRSITEFWQRWHMSLGTWFKDYVYIPLGGSRVSKAKLFRNIFVVWALTGFWHGAAWNFVIWGLFFAVLLTVEKFWLLDWLKKSKVLSHIYLLVIVAISFVIFNAADMKEAFSYIGSMFGFGGHPLVSAEWLYCLRNYGFVLALAAVGATPMPRRIVEKVKSSEKGERFINLLEPAVLVLLVVVMTAYLVDGSFNPFLYFRF